ncbi:MAG: PAS domain S-box protein [Gemmataceae bacterium]
MTPQTPLQILLVEDNSSDALLARMALTAGGQFDVTHVECLADALRHLTASQAIDAVLLDLDLPDSRGLESFTRLHRQFPRLPVVVLTGNDGDEIGLAAVQAGAQDFLVKEQFEWRELQRALRHAVERQQLVFNLNERVKELQGLHDATVLLRDEKLLIPELLRKFVAILPSTMQFSEIAAACASFGDVRQTTSNYQDTPWRLEARFTTTYGTSGSVCIVYLEEKPAVAADGPFLAEEWNLIHSLAEMLRSYMERRHALEQLRQGEEKFRLLFDLNPHPMWVFDLDTLEFLAVNHKAVEHYGYSRDEFLSMTILNIRPEEDVPRLRDYVAKLQSDFTYDGIWRHRLKDGRIIGVEISSQSMTWEKHRARLVLAVDVSKRLEAEEALKNTNEQLAQSQALMRVASRVTKLGGWSVSVPDFQITWTDEMRAIHEVEPDYTPHLDDVTIFYLPEYHESIQAAFLRCAREGVPFDGEYQLLTARHRPIWVRVVGEAVRDVTGTIRWVQGALQDITDQKQAEEREWKLANRLAETLENISDGFITLDREWRFTFLNRQAEKLLLRAREGLLGKNLWVEFADALGTMFEHEYRRAMDDQETVEFEEYYPLLDAWFGIRAYPTPEGLALYFRDVTDMRQVQDALRASEARFREMAENIEEVFYNYDPVADKMLYISPSYDAVWGQSREILYAKAAMYLEAIHPADRPIAAAAHQRQCAGVATDVEYRIRRPDGTICWLRDRSYPVRDAQGTVIRVVGVARDITASRQAEESLRFSEERFRLFAQATSDAIWDWDLSKDTAWWSEGFTTLFGHRMEDMVPPLKKWLDLIHPEDRSIVSDSIHHAIDSGQTTWSQEYRFLCKNGKYAYVLDRGHIIRDESGQAVRMIGGMTDLTEKKNLETQLFQSQKMEAIGQLAGGVAHDFNNLLTIINGYCEILLTLTPATDNKRSMLAEISAAGDRAANLTRQLLAFSRKQMLAPRILDLNAIVANIEKMLKRLIGEDIHMTTVLRPNLARIKVDPGQLEQVIVNLVVNARDAMPQGGQLTIESANVVLGPEDVLNKLDVQPGTYVALIVSDTGCGMTPDVQAHIFEPFFTTKEAGKGTGLGLATVFGIVKQSEGYIDVYSEVGMGTRFKVLFPAVVDEAQPAFQQAPPVEKGSETILLVEDEAGVRDMARMALETQGYRVLDAATGQEAIQIFQTHSGEIDLVITDVVMPAMSGREMIEQMRRQYPSLKVLYMSGYADDAVVRHGVIEATDAFLQKPFSVLNLTRKIREMLDDS